VLRQFISSGTGGSDAVNVAGGNTLEVLSNQLSNWVSKLSESFDARVNYRNKDNTNTGQDQVELALSTQLFNDRVSVDGNFGVSTSKSTTSNANNSVLDLTVEVKITNDGKFRIRGFNRSNDANIIRPYPYTQGVGVSYQTSFDTWKELLVNKRKLRKEQAERQRNMPQAPTETEKKTPPFEESPPDSMGGAPKEKLIKYTP